LTTPDGPARSGMTGPHVNRSSPIERNRPTRMFERTLTFFGKRSRTGIIAISLALVFLLGYIDYLSGPELVFSTFYLLPIVLVVWFAGNAWGLAFSFVAALVLLAADLASLAPGGNPLVSLWNEAVRLAGFVVVSIALGALRRVLEKEKHLARQDPLTGIANSRVFRELLAAEIGRARRYGRPLTLAYIDLDDFKAVNDRHGHGAGDELLKTAAAALEDSLRKTDTIARIGGDEFAVLLPETGGRHAREVMVRLQDRFCTAMRGHPTPANISIGVAAFERPPEAPDEVIGAADGLMYQAKAAGKNTLVLRIMDGEQQNATERHRC
jgi:diguanylate cyclase (GGDEF)-like protein